ncbi:histidine phosphatase family protein [Pseudotabrizicola sp.]|uniref:histidine phosphatase family protein n=1 Tax=Pseudotabrizicola sp. TaxID=2939647 RepID=UPI0027231C26|nr:histidine phosphatase family protein [Pseudotabrizicola sp.]MDO8883244.1 histidine phosphatase family protein [Pseudotabrizicola sp.]
MRAFFILLMLILAIPLRANPLDAARAPGAIVLMRHATAPGTGDPAGFRLGDCTTQRNLSDAGRAEAQAIGARFRAEGITFTHILTSEWCRTHETAELLGLGPVTPFTPANSFFSTRADESRQTAEVLEWLSAQPKEARVLIVTHQVNITALTGVVPQSGEVVIARRSGQRMVLVDRLPPP